MPKKNPRAWYIARQLAEAPDKWTRIEDLANQQFDRPVGFVSGGFDLLHASHIRLINEARSRSNTLIGLLDSDAKIEGLKGPGRPVLRWAERATALVYLGCDWVVEIDTDDDFIETCRVVVPDFRVLGFEYIRQRVLAPWVRRVFVRDGGTHTSDIVKRVKEAN